MPIKYLCLRATHLITVLVYIHNFLSWFFSSLPIGDIVNSQYRHLPVPEWALSFSPNRESVAFHFLPATNENGILIVVLQATVVGGLLLLVVGGGAMIDRFA